MELTIEQVVSDARAAGLAVRGAFHPSAAEFAPVLGAAPTGTIVLLGFTGGEQWPHFANAPEATDGIAHPLDRWSRRLIGALARRYDALDVYPSGAPMLPFQQLAMRCEPVHPSPLGLLIHPTYGLWHAYRGALVLPQVIALPPVPRIASPCDSCRDRPCLNGCPVVAFGPTGFALDRCAGYLTGADGGRCHQSGCQARAACPVGVQYRYGVEQMRFHMQAFVRAVAPQAAPDGSP